MTPRKLFFVMLGVLALTLVVTATGVYMTDKYLGEQAAIIGVLRAEDELSSLELINAQEIQNSLQEYSYIDVAANEILPDTKNQSEAILLINKIGTEVGVRTNKFLFLGTDGKPTEKSQTEPLAGAKGILVFPIQISFRGTYSQVINWLKLAEQNQRKMQVSSLSIGIAEIDGTYNPNDLLTVTIGIDAYVEN